MPSLCRDVKSLCKRWLAIAWRNLPTSLSTSSLCININSTRSTLGMINNTAYPNKNTYLTLPSYPFMFQKKLTIKFQKQFQRSYLNIRWEFELHTLPLFFNGSYLPLDEIWSINIRWIFFFRWKRNGNFWKKNGKKSLNVNLNTVVWVLNLETLPKIQVICCE